MMPITKHNFRVLDVKNLPEAVKRGWNIATNGRMGPVHIDLPSDVLKAEVQRNSAGRGVPRARAL